MSYTPLRQIGKGDWSNNPMTYCAGSSLDTIFRHTNGDIHTNASLNCQTYMANYCSKDWNDICEAQSQNRVPINYMYMNDITRGDLLVRNTAKHKYITHMSSNCSLMLQPFDPHDPESPPVGEWLANRGGGQCIPTYAVKPEGLDNDPVMNKLLEKPQIGIDILLNIYNNAKRHNTLESLQGTKLYAFFQTPYFQQCTVNHNLNLMKFPPTLGDFRQ